MMTLYFASNTCALASHIALEEASAEYRAVRVDLASDEQKSVDCWVDDAAVILAMQKKSRKP